MRVAGITQTMTAIWMALAAVFVKPILGRIETETSLEANGLTFDCTQLLPDNGEETAADVTNVMLLHGFPNNRFWYGPLLQFWEEEKEINVKAVACDLRGYSPGASPQDVSMYSYQNMVSDTVELARAAGMEEFHLVGHDHGAGAGWVTASQSDPDLKIRVSKVSKVG